MSENSSFIKLSPIQLFETYYEEIKCPIACLQDDVGYKEETVPKICGDDESFFYTELDLKYTTSQEAEVCHLPVIMDEAVSGSFEGVIQESKPFKCPICKYEAGGGCSFHLHMMIHTRQNVYECINDGCQYRGSSIEELVRHICKVHTSTTIYEQKTVEEEEKPQSNKCKYKTNVKCTLVKHIKKEKNFNCTSCGYKTSTEGYFLRHIKTHSIRNARAENKS